MAKLNDLLVYGATRLLSDLSVNGTIEGDLAGNADTASVATKLGTSTIGGSAQPFYLSAGTPTAFTGTIGGSAKPVYMNSGTITACSSTVGGTTRPIYMNAGTITEIDKVGVAYGGTGLSASPSMLVNLASTSAVNVLQASPRPGVTGTLPVANGGTGQTTANAAANAFINSLTTGSSTPTDADYYVTQYAGGGTTTTTYHRRPHSALWNWIKAKTATTSANGVMSSSDKSKLDGIATGATKVTVDSSISSTSTNPVQNKVVYSQLSGKMSSSPTSIELNSTGGLASYGGFIDFHYHNSSGQPTDSSGEVVSSTPDYTSRIIENGAGKISINNVAIKGSTITGSLSGTATNATYASSSTSTSSYVLRNSMLSSSEATPTTNGTICWIYE